MTRSDRDFDYEISQRREILFIPKRIISLHIHEAKVCFNIRTWIRRKRVIEDKFESLQ